MPLGMGRVTPASISGIVADAVLRQGVNIVVDLDEALPPADNRATRMVDTRVGMRPLARNRPRQVNPSVVADLIRGRRDHEMIDRMYILDGRSGPEILFDFVARNPGDHSSWNVTTDLPRRRLEIDPRLAAKETLARFQTDDAYRTCLREEARAAGIDPVSILGGTFAAAAINDGEGTGALDATTLTEPANVDAVNAPPQPPTGPPSDRATSFSTAASPQIGHDTSPPAPEAATRHRWKEHQSEYNGPWHFLSANYGKENLTWPGIIKNDRDLYFALKNNIKRNKVIPEGFHILDRVAVTDRKIEGFTEEERKRANAMSRALERRQIKARNSARANPTGPR